LISKNKNKNKNNNNANKKREKKAHVGGSFFGHKKEYTWG